MESDSWRGIWQPLDGIKGHVSCLSLKKEEKDYHEEKEEDEESSHSPVLHGTSRENMRRQEQKEHRKRWKYSFSTHMLMINGRFPAECI